ncbi:peptide-methionine (S)-S-oxide reductase MsrA [Prochlorococcus sp. MIT 1223]|uniref:peptide-methionine (S)-S-oxide reductase MsrA n=1 Tax=Prochlorococcus sp. MIT 1223 TaxID=3096217 RepID=UPI002A755264|nr:peptide-methionine (S)-S-oxide reductase MsrA [Prochlorococcus sp. MIT 1223]
MILSWLGINPITKRTNSTTTLKHQVLGTNLQAPLGLDQDEILFGCGCFWGAEKGFWRLPGVITTSVGYSGGSTENPSYNEVCSGYTGHAEVVRVTWNKDLIDISDLLKLFWECHDPTQGNRQGNDSGSQYRSAIYTYNAHNYEIAIKSKESYQEELNKKNYRKITTEIIENQKYYIGESYHQQYLAKPGSRPYCSAMPTNIKLGSFPGSNYKLESEIWSHYDWSIKHCVLRSDVNPIKVKGI